MQVTLVAVLATLSGSVVAGVPEGYSVGPASWQFDGPDGEVHFQGTIQEAEAQYAKMYPNAPRNVQTEGLVSRQGPTAAGDEDFRPGRTECINAEHATFHWKPAGTEQIKPAYNALWLNNSPLTVPKGPGFCSRISCKDDSGIYVCNDTDHELTFPKHVYIGKAAAELCTRCSAADIRSVCGGQIWEEKVEGGINEEWNVLIAEDLTC